LDKSLSPKGPEEGKASAEPFSLWPDSDHKQVRSKSGQRERVVTTGLGLTLTKLLIELHQGSISVESSGVPGEGTTFIIHLPL
jgi:signal transduction histidine kinase